jgi:hypothetical protein
VADEMSMSVAADGDTDKRVAWEAYARVMGK